MAMMGPTEILILFVMMFGGGAMLPPLGVPLGPDAGLESAVPPECLLYFSHAGVGTPQADSKNRVEQILAEPEIQAFAGEVSRLIEEASKRTPVSNEKERVLAANLPVVVKTLLLRPSILYVARLQTPPNQPTANAGLVVNAGERTADFVAALEEFEKLYLAELPPDQSVEKSKAGGAELRRLPLPPGAPPQAPPVVWGVKDQYVFLAVGEKEAETIVERLTAKAGAPQWLTDLQKELDVPRTTGVGYVNAAAIIKTLEPLFPLIAQESPPPLRDIGKLLDASGLRHLKHLAIAAGFDEEATVTKLSIGHDGTAEGLLALAEGRPLTRDDFRDIPRSIEFATVGRFDAKKLYEGALSIAEKIDPQARQAVDAVLGQAQEQLGFSVEKDLLAGLGDTITIYNSASEGGLLLTGLCVSISVRDADKIEKVIDRVLRLADAQTRESDRRQFDIRKTPAGARTISYVQVIGPSPVAPAWCLADDKLIVALSPQMVRSHLTRPTEAGSLADVEMIGKHLATGDVTSLSYQNTELGMQALYSYAQFLATVGAGMLEKETGIRADLAKFPSLGVISRHMRPSIQVSRSTKRGVLMESYAVGPSISPTAVSGVGMAAALVLPAIQSARSTAREMTSVNNLRQLTLAVLMYDQMEGHFPPQAIKSADGKPLLSWRVAILPHIDRAPLYEQFHLDEPWDSEHNRKLIPLMPEIFVHPSVNLNRDEGKTVYQIPIGAGTLYDAKRISVTEIQRSGVATSQAALLVEAARADAAVWTKPDDLEIDLQNFAQKLQADAQGRATIATTDGAVQNISLSDLKRLEEMLFPR